MFNFLFRLSRRIELTSLKTIQQRLQEVRSRQQSLSDERDALALRIESADASAAAREQELDHELVGLARRIRTLQAALPQAHAREAEACAQERQRLTEELRREHEDLQKMREAIFTDLVASFDVPSVEKLRELRTVSRECAELEYRISAITGERAVPFDAPHELRRTLRDRYEEFERNFAKVPMSRPDFSDRKWRQTAAALQALRESA